jgi:hypothetical protein
MAKPATDVSGIPERPTIYRSVSALIGGLLIVVLCAVGVVDLLANGYQDWKFIACATLLAVLGFVFGPYPAAFSDAHRLVVRNPFRRVVLPWPRVVAAHAGLSMTVNDENDKRYTIWAIPVSMRARRKVDRAQYRMIAIQRKEEARARRSGVEAFESRPKRGSGSRMSFGIGGLGAGFSGGSTGFGNGDTPEYSYADQAEKELEERRAACTDAREDTAQVQTTLTWWTIALCVLAAAFVIVAFTL